MGHSNVQLALEIIEPRSKILEVIRMAEVRRPEKLSPTELRLPRFVLLPTAHGRRGVVGSFEAQHQLIILLLDHLAHEQGLVVLTTVDALHELVPLEN